MFLFFFFSFFSSSIQHNSRDFSYTRRVIFFSSLFRYWTATTVDKALRNLNEAFVKKKIYQIRLAGFDGAKFAFSVALCTENCIRKTGAGLMILSFLSGWCELLYMWPTKETEHYASRNRRRVRRNFLELVSARSELLSCGLVISSPSLRAYIVV